MRKMVYITLGIENFVRLAAEHYLACWVIIVRHYFVYPCISLFSSPDNIAMTLHFYIISPLPLVLVRLLLQFVVQGSSNLISSS